MRIRTLHRHRLEAHVLTEYGRKFIVSAALKSLLVHLFDRLTCELVLVVNTDAGRGVKLGLRSIPP